LAGDLWPVLIDISQIETALLNVALNARDAMPGGGVLGIEKRSLISLTSEERRLIGGLSPSTVAIGSLNHTTCPDRTAQILSKTMVTILKDN
jgi:hypothetical protein